jgi:hypothetical protein
MNTRRGKPTGRGQGLLVHLRRAQARKIPLRHYCRANGLKVQSMYNLRSQLASTKSRRPQAPTPKKRKAAEPFIAVRVASPMVAPAAACRLQIKGWVIECANLPSPEWLAGVMAGETHAVP